MMYEIAVNSLIKIFNEDGYLNKIISNEIEKNNWNIQEKKIYTKIVYGVVENKLLIDYYLQPYIKGKRVKPFIKNVLRIGAYVITFMDIANHFIVDKMVSVVKKRDYNGSKFVNGVLRNYERDKRRKLESLSHLDYLSIKYSMPKELVEYLGSIYINLEDILKGINTGNEINSYRINGLKQYEIKHEELLGAIVEKDMIYSKESLLNTDIFKNGVIVAQNYSSTLPPRLLNPIANDIVLDACSAPGMKTIQMADMMNNMGKIIALDIHDHKISLINENAKKLNAKIIETKKADASKVEFAENYFDKILVDAPCSGLGVIGHKPDLKYRVTKEKIKELGDLGYSILKNVSKYLKVNGELVYSTCTITKIENEEVISKFIKENNNFKKVHEETILPNEKTDGFYLCKLIKNK